MGSFLMAAQVILPLLILMVLGVLLRKTNLMDEATYKKLNTLIFKVFLPPLIFYNVYKSELSEAFDGKLILFAVLCILALFFVLVAVVPLIEKDDRRRGAIIQGIFRSNFVIFGVPLTVALMGDAAAGKVAVVVAFVVPLFNFLAVISLEVFRHGKPDIKKILKGIVTNPLIIASALGILSTAIGLKLPKFLETAVSDVAKIATPLALIVLGASLDFALLKKNSIRVLLVTAARLVFVPLVFLTIAILLGFRGVDIAILISVFASPTAVSSYAMAQQMGADDALAGQIVASTTAFCVFTVFLFVFGLDLIGVL
ncbi:MAG: AEC family transporter [Clostridia bacterium]|nr:AEC family transporter [Clostridia bacterium]